MFEHKLEHRTATAHFPSNDLIPAYASVSPWVCISNMLKDHLSSGIRMSPSLPQGSSVETGGQGQERMLEFALESSPCMSDWGDDIYLRGLLWGSGRQLAGSPGPRAQHTYDLLACVCNL